MIVLAVATLVLRCDAMSTLVPAYGHPGSRIIQSYSRSAFLSKLCGLLTPVRLRPLPQPPFVQPLIGAAPPLTWTSMLAGASSGCHGAGCTRKQVRFSACAWKVMYMVCGAMRRAYLPFSSLGLARNTAIEFELMEKFFSRRDAILCERADTSTVILQPESHIWSTFGGAGSSVGRWWTYQPPA